MINIYCCLKAPNICYHFSTNLRRERDKAEGEEAEKEKGEIDEAENQREKGE